MPVIHAMWFKPGAASQSRHAKLHVGLFPAGNMRSDSMPALALLMHHNVYPVAALLDTACLVRVHLPCEL